MRFAYSEYDAPPSPADMSETVWRPMMKVRVAGSARAATASLWGLLDTGAVECVLPRDMAEAIAPLWVTGDWFLTGHGEAADRVEYGLVRLSITLGPEHIRWPAIVAFSKKRKDAIWGHAGFLEHFSATFNGPGRYFTIRRRKEGDPRFEVNPIPRRPKRGSDRGRIISRQEQDPDG